MLELDSGKRIVEDLFIYFVQFLDKEKIPISFPPEEYPIIGDIERVVAKSKYMDA